jgi:Flp pilus assembly pilin Flp
MQTFLLRFAENESGTTVIKYTLVAGLISVACIGAITAISIAATAAL